MQQDGSFKAIVNRFNVTPVEDLPRVAAFLASSLAACPLEVYFSDAKTNTASVTTHKLKTRISALLQDRSAAGRLSAAIFIKAIIDTAGSNLLSASEPWARGLVSCLSKSEAPEIKRLYLTTVMRIFLLTQHQPALLREITTPLLPSFLTACLSLIRPSTIKSGDKAVSVSSPLLDTVLQCWLQLLPQHASIFRPFLNRIKPICLSLVEDHSSPQPTTKLSIQLLCALISCAPKNTAGQEWTQMATSIAEAAHKTTNHVFRTVLEEYNTNNSSLVLNTSKHNFSKPPGISGKDQLGLSPWTGISEGSSRVETLISWLEHLVSLATIQQIPVPCGDILDLTARILSVNPSERQGRHGHNLRFHNEAGKEEKEELLSNLPKLQLSCLALLLSLCRTYEQSILPLYRTIFNQALLCFQASSWHQGARALCYEIIGHVMNMVSLSELDINRTSFAALMTESCDDLKTALSTSDFDKSQDSSKALNLALNTNRNTNKNLIPLLMGNPSGAFASAWRLLPVLLGRGTVSIVPRQSRTELDRLAILLNHQEAMLASVLNPISSTNGNVAAASILPFLTRTSTDMPAVEALLRPRFPFIRQESGQTSSHDLDASVATSPSEKNGDRDILSQLENSLNDISRASVEVDIALEVASGLEHETATTSEPLLSPKKRYFEQLEENETSVKTTGLLEDEIRSPKRHHPDDSVNTIPAAMEYEVGGTATVSTLRDQNFAPGNGPSSEKHQDLSFPNPGVVGVSNNLHKEATYDSDSSDFEIPKIDTGLDTDEEDEEDEEDAEEDD
ncbi:hypothetical protein LTR84_008359 [Exophiala bonariae]|uniref:Pre-rRNA-processing protein RIX1 n=1 Tax=Exophiala bonariae TaxID=1690606 RepID=A0AAV9MXD2_9EURO|nr:hypothetical protein LTR84_008359 [Exophiala bonariae]